MKLIEKKILCGPNIWSTKKKVIKIVISHLDEDHGASAMAKLKAYFVLNFGYRPGMNNFSPAKWAWEFIKQSTQKAGIKPELFKIISKNKFTSEIYFECGDEDLTVSFTKRTIEFMELLIENPDVDFALTDHLKEQGKKKNLDIQMS